MNNRLCNRQVGGDLVSDDIGYDVDIGVGDAVDIEVSDDVDIGDAVDDAVSLIY